MSQSALFSQFAGKVWIQIMWLDKDIHFFTFVVLGKCRSSSGSTMSVCSTFGVPSLCDKSFHSFTFKLCIMIVHEYSLFFGGF